MRNLKKKNYTNELIYKTETAYRPQISKVTEAGSLSVTICSAPQDVFPGPSMKDGFSRRLLLSPYQESYVLNF